MILSWVVTGFKEEDDGWGVGLVKAEETLLSPRSTACYFQCVIRESFITT